MIWRIFRKDWTLLWPLVAVVAALHAVVADAAMHGGMGGDEHADGEALRRGRDDAARELVAEHHAGAARAVLTQIAVQLRAADADGVDVDENVLGTELGLGDVLDPDVLGLVENCCLHRLLLSVPGA